MKSDLLIMVDSPFAKRDYDRFGVEILERHFKVGVLDLTPWLKPRVWASFSSAVHSFPGYHAILDAADFKNNLPGTEKCIAIDYLGGGSKPKWVRKELSVRGVRRAVVLTGTVPELPQKTLFEKIRSLKCQTNLVRALASRFWHLVSAKINKEVPPDIALVGGTESLKNYRIGRVQEIAAHSFDYDVYLNMGRAVKTPSRPYAVYLDENLAHHPDYLQLGVKPFVREENYFPALMRFFAMFERVAGMEVIFAAHPRSRWELRSHWLEGRIPVYGKTAELVRDAQLAFAHASTSISFAVLWQIPLVFLTSDELEDSRYREEMVIRSQMFKVPLINIDRSDHIKVDLTAWRKVDQEAYDSYKERYIKNPGTPELPVWEIFAKSTAVREVLG